MYETKALVNQAHEAEVKVGHDTNNVKTTVEAQNKLNGCYMFEREAYIKIRQENFFDGFLF